MSVGPEHLQPPLGIEMHRLGLENPGKFNNTADRLLKIYASPFVRVSLIEPPRVRADILRDMYFGDEVYYATDLTGKLTSAVTLVPQEGKCVRDSKVVQIRRFVVTPELPGQVIKTHLLNHVARHVFAGEALTLEAKVLCDVPEWQEERDFYESHGFMEWPELEEIAQRDIGPVREFPVVPFDGLKESLKSQHGLHYISQGVPVRIMILTREDHLALQVG